MQRREPFVQEEPARGGYDAAVADAARGVEIQDRLEELDRATRAWVRAHPIASVVLVAAAGFVVGRVASRSL